jgi:acyl carrier protein
MSTLESEPNPLVGTLTASPPADDRAEGDSAAVSPAELAAIAERLKRLIVDNLHLEGLSPEQIDDQAPLFGEGLGLDSVDALELVVAVEKEFGIKIKSNEIGREVFSSVASLALFIAGRT